MTLDQIKAALVAQAGGYLRNTIVANTCPVCRTLTDLRLSLRTLLSSRLDTSIAGCLGVHDLCGRRATHRAE